MIYFLLIIIIILLLKIINSKRSYNFPSVGPEGRKKFEEEVNKTEEKIKNILNKSNKDYKNK